MDFPTFIALFVQFVADLVTVWSDPAALTALVFSVIFFGSRGWKAFVERTRPDTSA